MSWPRTRDGRKVLALAVVCLLTQLVWFTDSAFLRFLGVGVLIGVPATLVVVLGWAVVSEWIQRGEGE